MISESSMVSLLKRKGNFKKVLQSMPPNSALIFYNKWNCQDDCNEMELYKT